MRQHLKTLTMVSLLMLVTVFLNGCAGKALKPTKTDDVTWNRYKGDAVCIDDESEKTECRVGDVMIPPVDLSNLFDRIYSQCNK